MRLSSAALGGQIRPDDVAVVASHRTSSPVSCCSSFRDKIIWLTPSDMSNGTMPGFASVAAKAVGSLGLSDRLQLLANVSWLITHTLVP